MLALISLSCTKKEKPYLYGEMTAFVVQKEVVTDDTTDPVTVETRFVPNLNVWAVSKSTMTGSLYEGGGSIPYHYQFRHLMGGTYVYETMIDDDRTTNSLASLNTTYTFMGTNANGQQLTLWAAWSFRTTGDDSDVFPNNGWNQYDPVVENRKITAFNYTAGNLEIVFDPIEGAGSYWVYMMNTMDVAGAQRLSRAEDVRWQVLSSSAGGEFRGPVDPKYDGYKVFLAAVKNTPRGNMMLLSAPKTINVAKGVFDEDDVPEPPEP